MRKRFVNKSVDCLRVEKAVTVEMPRQKKVTDKTFVPLIDTAVVLNKVAFTRACDNFLG